ncbi:hypothetical protein EV122DRAFT_291556 [Schizophyllum commune]
MSPTWFAALALPSLRTASRPMGRAAVSETQDIITQVCVTLALYGCYTDVFPSRKRGNAWKLLSAVTLAFIASSIGILTQMLAFVTQCPLIDLFPTDPTTLAYRLAVLHVVSCRINYVLSDALLVWRAWVLWHDRRVVHGLLAFCLILSAVGVIYETASLPSRIWSNDLPSTLIINLPLLFTNVVATALVGLRVWFYRREVAAYISPMSTGTHIGGVLMLLFEAGAVYCVISVINLAVDISASLGSSSTPVVFTNAMFLIAGIYPTLIVVAVTAQQHAATKAAIRGPSSFLESMHFAALALEEIEERVIKVIPVRIPLICAGDILRETRTRAQAICLSERTKASIWRSNVNDHAAAQKPDAEPRTRVSRSPSLESVSSVQSLASMQSAESVNSFISTASLDEGGAKTSDHENLNDIDMGRTITSIPIPPPSASENGQGVDDPSSKTGDWANTCHDGLEPSSTTNPSSRPAVKPALLNTKKHNRFYMDPRTIQLVLDDGTLYRVFRQSFEEHSSAFTTQYLADYSEDNPIKLPGVSSVDLDRFLSLMYPSELATCELSTADEWISVLRLAHKWSFAALRTRAIREVKAIGTAVDRIASAREFSDLDKLQEWLLPAFTETCTASDWLQTTTVDDAERLGAGTLLHIARIREDARQTTTKSSICAIERAIVAAGLAPATSRETCAEPSALPAHVTLNKPPASAPLEIPSSPCIVPKPTTTLDAQGSGSASPPSAPVDTSSVNLAAPIPLRLDPPLPLLSTKQSPPSRPRLLPLARWPPAMSRQVQQALCSLNALHRLQPYETAFFAALLATRAASAAFAALRASLGRPASRLPSVGSPDGTTTGFLGACLPPGACLPAAEDEGPAPARAPHPESGERAYLGLLVWPGVLVLSSLSPSAALGALSALTFVLAPGTVLHFCTRSLRLANLREPAGRARSSSTGVRSYIVDENVWSAVK